MAEKSTKKIMPRIEKEQGSERECWVAGQLTWLCWSLDLSSNPVRCRSTILQAVQGPTDACQHEG